MAAPRQDNLKTVDEVFLDSILPTPPGPTPLWGPGSIPDNWGRRQWISQTAWLSAILKSE